MVDRLAVTLVEQKKESNMRCNGWMGRCLFFVGFFSDFHPAARHLHGLGPLLVQFRAGLGGDLWLEGGTVGAVHVLQIGEILPHVDGEGGGDCGTQGGGFVHGGPFDGDLNDIGLCLQKKKKLGIGKDK